DGEGGDADDINSVNDAVGAAFDLLPDIDELETDVTNYAADTGSANSVAVSLPHTAASYTDAMKVVFKAKATNTGNVTINVDTLGSKSIVAITGEELDAGNITINKIYTVRYNSTSGKFVFESTLTSSASAAASATAAALSADEAEAAADIATSSAGNRSRVNTTFQALRNNTILTDSGGGAFTITMPAAPTGVDYVKVIDSARTWGTNNVTLARNGKTIGGDAENFTCNVSGGHVELWYDATDGNWT
ncbi:unnamed protein product, partial [marine sediment metagenome]